MAVIKQIKAGIIFSSVFFCLVSCKQNDTKETAVASHAKDSALDCQTNIPSRFSIAKADSSSTSGSKTASHEGMVLITAGETILGATDNEGRKDGAR